MAARISSVVGLLLEQELLLHGRVDLGEGGDHLLARDLGLVEQGGGDLLLADELAVVAVEVEGLHLDEVDDPLEAVLEPDLHLGDDDVVAQLLLELVGHPLAAGPGPVELVDEGQAGHVVAPHLPVDGVRLGLHAGHATEHEHGAVEHAQGPLHLDGEVDVARRVDEVDVVVVPLAVGRRRLDGDALFALQIHEVHGRAHTRLPLDLFDLVNAPAVKEDALRQRGLPGVDVSRDADVSDLVDRDSGHGLVILSTNSPHSGGKGAVV